MSTQKQEVSERINSIEDILSIVGEANEEVVAYKKLLELLGPDHHATNYQLAILIAKAYNEGWEPDWNNSDEWKYFPYFRMGGSSGFRFGGNDCWTSGSDVGSRLCFKDEEHVNDAAAKFIDVYTKLMIIKK